MTGAPGSPTPVATYRLQLHAGFTFADAAAVVPYLADLGISHLYLSPILQAVPGSLHGYDQCDPTRISEELGGEPGFRRLVAETRAHGMGIVLDIVPNHMAANDANPWWWELLKSGRRGRAGAYFDIDWATGERELDGRVMLPVLGRPLEEAVAAGEVRRSARDGQPVLVYFDQSFPLREPVRQALVSTELLDRQHYLMAFWREAQLRLNYRRFFDINSLVALREEDPAVFAAVHDLPLRLVEDGLVQGLRVDHVDGLRDPLGYLNALRGRAPGAWLLVEKILEPGERLPAAWPVDGTTGYDFIHRLQGVFIDPEGAEPMTTCYREFTGEDVAYPDVVREAKRELAASLFGSDFARLDRAFARVCASQGVSGDSVARVAVLSAVAACLPVYRTYRRAGTAADDADRARTRTAAGAARDLDPALDPGLVDALVAALLGDVEGADADELTARFQQVSGPLMAKGVEDTAFYRYNRLVCLNEVGADPGTFGVSPPDFHAANLESHQAHPTTMLASSTHDTKRSEDVRARLSLLAQVPDEWDAAVRRWAGMNDRYRRQGVPDRNAEYLLYQTLVGAWPLPEDRAVAYMEKAAREARRHTSWTDPQRGYEDALRAFVSAVSRDPDFQAELRAFAQPLVEPGRAVTLAMTLVRLMAPGIPDIYQGSECWDLSLVDPDNRRPVDYKARRELLARLREDALKGSSSPAPALRGDGAGLTRVHVTAQALRLRKTLAAAFDGDSTYTPLEVAGTGAGHVLAFARGTVEDPRMVAVAVPRLDLRREVDWTATTITLGAGEWVSQLEGYRVSGPVPTVAEVRGRLPVALLRRDR